MKSQCCGRSTTFASARRRRAAAAITRSTRRSPVAATASTKPRGSERRNGLARWTRRPLATSATSPGVNDGLTIVTRAPQSEQRARLALSDLATARDQTSTAAEVEKCREVIGHRSDGGLTQYAPQRE